MAVVGVKTSTDDEVLASAMELFALCERLERQRQADAHVGFGAVRRAVAFPGGQAGVVFRSLATLTPPVVWL
jgi:hypothetical protein